MQHISTLTIIIRLIWETFNILQVLFCAFGILYALHRLTLWGNLSTVLLYVILSTWCERSYLLAVVLPFRNSLQEWGSSYCFIHLRSCLSLLIVFVRSLYCFLSELRNRVFVICIPSNAVYVSYQWSATYSLLRWLPASLEWWWVGLGSYNFVAYPSYGSEWFLTTELFLGVLLLWCCVSIVGVLLYYGFE